MVSIFDDPQFISLFLLSLAIGIVFNVIISVLRIILLIKEIRTQKELGKVDFLMYKRIR